MKLLIALLFPLVLSAQDLNVDLIVLDTGLDSPYAILVTGFGPFGSVVNNPSGRIAKLLPSQIEQACAKPEWKFTSKKLAVKPGVILENSLSSYATVISLGVDAGSDRIRLERFSRNFYSDPFTGMARKIDAHEDKNHLLTGPRIPSSVPSFLEGFSIELGDENSAGTYVCNETFYQLCRSHKKGYFVHVPNVNENRDLELSKALATISCKYLSEN